ncbi:hypothetical protein ON010_g16957 [Phytophthora cinnamomi]|nr:hypothetical protein ON010_g16957 [Phytophthora cinnamomi]
MSVETSSGEQQLIVATSDGDSIQVPVPGPLPELLHSDPNPYANPYANQEEPEQPVEQTVDVVNDDGDHEQVIVVGDVEDGKQTIEVANDQDDYTEKEVVAVETDQSESTVVPDGNGGTTVVNVPDVPDVIADLATDDTQVVNVVNPDNGAQQQIVIEDAPEDGEVTVDIVNESGEVTTEDVTVVESDDGLKLEVPTDNGIVPVVVPDVPADVQEEIAEEENPVIVDGEPDHGVQTVEIPTDNGDYVETQVKAVETDDGVKLAIPDAQGETTVVTVPDVPAAVAQEASDDTLVLNVESPSGEMQQVIIVGKPENGLQTIQIVDQHGELVTEEVKATETSEVTQITVLTDGGYIPVTIPDVPKEAKEEIADQQAEAADADGDAVVAIVPEVVDEFAKMATMEALTKTTAKNLQSWVYENRQSLRRGNPFDQEEDASVMQTTDVANDFGGLR